jgi:hypothetical protein
MSQHLAPLLSVPGSRKLLNQGASEGSAFGGAAITTATVIALLTEIIVVSSPLRFFVASDLSMSGALAWQQYSNHCPSFRKGIMPLLVI